MYFYFFTILAKQSICKKGCTQKKKIRKKVQVSLILGPSPYIEMRIRKTFEIRGFFQANSSIEQRIFDKRRDHS
jgi:hypothetical protein